jgi:hypothetical protein
VSEVYEHKCSNPGGLEFNNASYVVLSFSPMLRAMRPDACSGRHLAVRL